MLLGSVPWSMDCHKPIYETGKLQWKYVGNQKIKVVNDGWWAKRVPKSTAKNKEDIPVCF